MTRRKVVERTFKSRCPFLFGEVRLPIIVSQLTSQEPPQSWESRGVVDMPFLIEAVTQWFVVRCRDQIGQRGLSIPSTEWLSQREARVFHCWIAS